MRFWTRSGDLVHPRQATRHDRGRLSRNRLITIFLAITCALLALPVTPAWAQADTDGGPGVWGPASWAGRGRGPSPTYTRGPRSRWHPRRTS
jgi:hypothetical protein